MMRFMDGVGDDTPNLKIARLINAYGAEVRIVRYEPGALTVSIQPKLFEGVFAVYVCNDEITVLGGETAINNHDVAVQNACIAHGVTLDMRIEGGLGMRCHLPRQVNALADMVCCG